MLVHRFLASSDAEEAQYYSEYHRTRDVILALHETCYPSIPNTKRLQCSEIVWASALWHTDDELTHLS